MKQAEKLDRFSRLKDLFNPTAEQWEEFLNELEAERKREELFYMTHKNESYPYEYFDDVLYGR